MSVYLIRAGMTGPVKIGSAINPMDRIRDLQVAHYEQLRLVRLWEGGRTEELALQARFADLHIRGEWFSFSRLMMADVGLVKLPLPPLAPDLVSWAYDGTGGVPRRKARTKRFSE